MIQGIEIKVCGLRSAGDARIASAAGADYLGFIFHPGSPRYIDFDGFAELQPRLPSAPKVAVAVAPDLDTLGRLADLGFDFFQIHYPVSRTSRESIEAWVSKAGRERLWLAPRLSPDDALDDSSLELADTWLWDAYSKDAFGGTGKRSDWDGFLRMSRSHPSKQWILAGGLGPDNVVEAVKRTGATRLDLNSGVEKSPGVKDPSKLESVKVALNSL